VHATALAAAYAAAFTATAGCAVALAAGGALAADAEGSRIFLSACAGCHGDRGQGNAGLGAPNIGGLDAWYIERQLHDFASGMRGTDARDAYGARMRAALAGFTDDARRKAVAATIAALPRVPAARAAPFAGADVANGRDYFNRICSGCHNSNGLGSAALSAPRLAGTDPAYLLRQLVAFRSGARGSHLGDPFGGQMRKIVLALPGPATDRDLIAYLAGLPAGAVPGALP
jgi:cytochrome c553